MKERTREDEHVNTHNTSLHFTQSYHLMIQQLDAQQTELEMKVMEINNNNQNKKKQIAVYKTTEESSQIRWNVTKIEPTVKNWLRFKDRKKSDIQVMQSGLYRIYYRWYSRERRSNVEWRSGALFVNGKCIACSSNRSSNPNAFGSICEVMYLNENDWICCCCDNKQGTYERHCILIIEKLE